MGLSRFYSDSDFACNGEKDYNIEAYGYPCGCGGSLAKIDQNLIDIIDEIAEECIKQYGVKPDINCCWRCDVHNKRVGGQPGINHNADPCYAVDFDATIIGVDNLARIAENLRADGVGRYYDDLFVHVDVRSGRIADEFRW